MVFRRSPSPTLCALICAILLACLAQLSHAQPPAPAAEKPAGDAKPAADAKAPDKPAVTVHVGENGVSVYAVNADAHDVFSKLAAATGLALIVDDTVQGQVTVNIVNKKPMDIIGLIVDAYGFSYSQVDQAVIVSEGVPKKPSSYLLSEIEAVTTKYVQPARARSLLPLFLQSDVKMNADQNSVVLSAPRAVLDKFRKDIEQFDVPAAQIMLDVLVVEYTNQSTDTFASALGYKNANFGMTTDSITGQSVLTAVTELTHQFYADLQALITKRHAKVRANPRVATVSGVWASVFIGQERYLSKPVRLPNGNQTYSIDAGVRLSMKPLTGGQGEIILTLDQEVSTLSAPDPKTGLPNKTKRTANTTVRVKDGQTVVIGGLRQSEMSEKRTRIPIISEIPLIGQFFRSKRIENTTVELALFVTARILDPTGHLPKEEEDRIRTRFLGEETKAQP